MTPSDQKQKFIPYSRQDISEQDIEAVISTLQSDWLTTGPKVSEFERAVAEYVGAQHCVAVSSGTAALHCALYALGVGPGDEVIVPAITFVATANAALYLGARPRFVDLDPDTLLVDPAAIERAIGPKTKAIAAVDLCGHPCEYDLLLAISDRFNLPIVSDASHALGATYRGKRVGSLASLSTFSFHPVKPITTAEGGMIATDSADFANRMRLFRGHGVGSDHRQRAVSGNWEYDMVELGYNFRLSDLQSALGISQLQRCDQMMTKRRELANRYRNLLANLVEVEPLVEREWVESSYHLFIVRILAKKSKRDRDSLYRYLREAGIGSNVHYKPVYMHSYYAKTLGYPQNICPVAEQAYEEILSLPLYSGMREEDIEKIVDTIKQGVTT